MSDRSRSRSGQTDDGIKRSTIDGTGEFLLRNGVSRRALRTTLEKEGRNDLRSVITERLMVDEHGDMKWVYFYPAQSRNRKQYLANVLQCELIFGLFLKECLLTGLSVTSTTTVRLMQAMDLYDDEYIQEITASVYNTTTALISVDGFHLDSTVGERFNSKGIQERIEDFMIRTWYGSNVGFILQGAEPPTQIEHGWSSRIVSIIDSTHTLSYQVSGKEVR